MTKTTHFHDMASGGTRKTEYHYIFVEAEHDRAVRFFKSWFDRNPFHVSCDCCGADFSVTEHESLRQATAFNRNCAYDKEEKRYLEEPDTRLDGTTKELIPLDEYIAQDGVGYFSEETVEMELER